MAPEPRARLAQDGGGVVAVLASVGHALGSAPFLITSIGMDVAPFLILHGDKDSTVQYSQSEMLVEALKKASVEVTLKRIEGPAFNTPENRETIEALFDRHLRKAKQWSGWK